jgi:hypothetical protein
LITYNDLETEIENTTEFNDRALRVFMASVFSFAENHYIDNDSNYKLMYQKIYKKIMQIKDIDSVCVVLPTRKDFKTAKEYKTAKEIILSYRKYALTTYVVDCIDDKFRNLLAKTNNSFYINFNRKMNRLAKKRGTYTKGSITYIYTKNSRAEDMSKSRKLHKTPLNISKDYTSMMYDINEDKTLTFNKEKAKNLLWSLQYQFKIRFTNLTFYDKDNNIVKINYSHIKKLEDYILNQKIDLSRGIYSNATHHVRIDNSNTTYASWTDKAIGSELIKFLKNNYTINYYGVNKKNYNKNDLTKTYHLNNISELIHDISTGFISFDNKVEAVNNQPKHFDSEVWNSEMDGYPLKLNLIPSIQKVHKFEKIKKVEKPLTLIYKVSPKIEDAEVNKLYKQANKYHKKYANLSTLKSINLRTNNKIINHMLEYYKHVFSSKNIDELKDTISSFCTSSFYSYNKKTKQNDMKENISKTKLEQIINNIIQLLNNKYESKILQTA